MWLRAEIRLLSVRRGPIPSEKQRACALFSNEDRSYLANPPTHLLAQPPTCPAAQPPSRPPVHPPRRPPAHPPSICVCLFECQAPKVGVEHGAQWVHAGWDNLPVTALLRCLADARGHDVGRAHGHVCTKILHGQGFDSCRVSF